MKQLTDEIHYIYFLGIGGIGMSALARYFHSLGYSVSGYDRTPSALTKELEQEGIRITYIDALNQVSCMGLAVRDTLVVRTPAVPNDSIIYTYLRNEGYTILKRAEVLGIVTRQKKALCVAGTHGKTTTSTMLAHLLQPSSDADLHQPAVSAFLGGISMNYQTNVLTNPKSEYVVVEADEYDRSFHQLTPFISVVTAVDADHLDIYGTPEAYREAFVHYTSLITGALVMKHGIEFQPRLQEGVKGYTYGVLDNEQCPKDNRPDFYAANIRVGNGNIIFDFHAQDKVVADIELGVPVWVNIENSVAAMAVYWLFKEISGMNREGDAAECIRHMKEAMRSYKGVLRRFNIHVNTPRVVYIDDYAHHPDEIDTAIKSVRKLYPDRRLIGVFQPHLYTRTRDFAADFTRVLATLDECVLLPIYPAREEPIPGVSSEMLGGEVVEKKELVAVLQEKIICSAEPVVVLTIGAGDIDRLVPEITEGISHL